MFVKKIGKSFIGNLLKLIMSRRLPGRVELDARADRCLTCLRDGRRGRAVRVGRRS
jgi:hypothetical protein